MAFGVAVQAATFDRILVTPKTNVRVFSSSYRLVFMLDVSTSMAIVDPCTGEVLYDQLFNILKNTFRSLIQPISIPGSGTQVRSSSLKRLGDVVLSFVSSCIAPPSVIHHRARPRHTC
jgi:hypothetical protein